MCPLYRLGWRAETEAKWQEARGVWTSGDSQQTWSLEKATAFYATALKGAAEVANQSVSSGFEETRKRTFEEYSSFVGQVGQGLTVQNARGLDKIAFVQGSWIPAHKSRCRTVVGGSGEKVSSASAVKLVIQHKAKSYAMMGRGDSENPAKEESVKNYRGVSKQSARARGERETRACIQGE